MSNGEVKRYIPHTYHGGDVVTPSMEENEHGAWVKHDAHERIVDELRGKISHAAKANHQAWNEIRAKDIEISGQVDIIKELRAEINRLTYEIDKSRDSHSKVLATQRHIIAVLTDCIVKEDYRCGNWPEGRKAIALATAIDRGET